MSGVRKAVLRAVVAAAGTQLGLRLGAHVRHRLGPLDVDAAVAFARAGATVLDVPPLGHVRLATHRGPLRVTARASGLDPDRATGLLRMPAGDADADAIKAQLGTVLTAIGADARALGVELAKRAACSGIGGATTLAALTFRRPRDIAATAGLALAGLAAAGAAAALTRDQDAWRNPELDGLLTRAPLILGDLQQAPARIGVYRDQLADLLRTGTGVYRRIAELPEPPPADAIRLVHVSDIHLSPLALPLATAIVDEYGADAVIDTGDLVDWGTPAENAFAAQIAGLGVPYVYVKGNHDSAGTAAAVGRQSNAVVLVAGEAPRTVAGLVLAGMADPRFTPDKTTGDDHAERRVSVAAAEFAATLPEQGIDVALVHDPAAARALEGRVPLVLAGHIHRRETRRFGDTTVLVQGSSGGSGLRGVQADPPTPITLSVLFVDRTTRRLWGVDEVTLGGLGARELSVVRRPVDELRSPSGRR